MEYLWIYHDPTTNTSSDVLTNSINTSSTTEGYHYVYHYVLTTINNTLTTNEYMECH